MPPKPSRPGTGSGRSEPRGIDQAGELIGPQHTPAIDGLSSRYTKAGRLCPETITVRPGVVANTVRHSVVRDGVEVFLSPQLFEIFLYVAKARFGATPEQLFTAIYAGAIDGGPLSGRKAIHVQRRNLNRKLAPLGLRIESAGSGFRDGVYELQIRESHEMPAATARDHRRRASNPKHTES